MRKYPDLVGENNKGQSIIFSPGGIVIGKKIVCMRKNAEVNCLPQRYIWKKLSAETTYVMQDLRNFKKNCLHSLSGGKKLANSQSMVEKNFLPPRNHHTPRGENNGPSLKRLLAVSSTHIRFVGD